MAELHWLADQLDIAEKQHSHVWLVFHIPYGIDNYNTARRPSRITLFWQPIYQQKLIKLLDQYSSEMITTIISSHIHMDGFQRHYLIINPFVSSISPIFGNNPSYKYYLYDKNNFKLENFMVYYLDLAATPLLWKQEYNFNHHYQPNCVHCFVSQGLLAIYKYGQAMQSYQRYYTISSKQLLITRHQWRYYWCGINNATPKSFHQCLKIYDSINP